ncbi:hypothetical protein JXJ21_21930 [candidate division KSB1 bacterium]|nr:hypothetical protein [candidate division KSB1 bacterium]
MKIIAFKAACLALLLSSQLVAQTTLDLASWRFKPDAANIGLEEKWYAESIDESDWAVLNAGIRWEDQGYPQVDSVAWYRKTVTIPAAWADRPIWLLFGGLNDAYTLYCNGQLVNSYGDETVTSIAALPTVAELSRYLRIGQPNVIALRIYDWGASGGIWQLPCMLTINSKKLESIPFLTGSIIFERNKLVVGTELSCLGNRWANAAISIEILDAKSLRLLDKGEFSATESATEIKTFPLDEMAKTSQYLIKALAKLPGELVAFEQTTTVEVPEPRSWGREYSALKVLNNFVTELLNVTLENQGEQQFSFLNPRDGWVFFSISGTGDRKTAPVLMLDAESNPLILRINPDTKAGEAMRFLAAGKHSLTAKSVGGARLIIRAIPEIIYSDYPSSPHIKPYGDYDWQYLDRYVLSNVNTIITGGLPPENEHLKQWVREGRKWLVHSGLPGLNAAKAPAAEEVAQVWAKNRGACEPPYSGIIVDEFLLAGSDHYRAWTEGLRLLHATESFADKTFYAYCGDLFRRPNTPAIHFANQIMAFGDRLVIERYFQELPTEAEAEYFLLKELQQLMRDYRKNLPGVEHHLVICLGYLSDPPETLNLNPGVNYKVYMEMQFRLLATDPSFWGLFGIQEYLSRYADEEALRWAHRLFSHYCIEGNRQPLSAEPYLLPYIQNPDFADSLHAWQAEPAQDGSIAIKRMEGFSWLQGRYPTTAEGDQFLWMKRSAARPNIVRQTVENLVPDQVYLLKFYSADIRQLGKEQTLALSASIKNAEIIEAESFQFPYPSCYSHTHGNYNADHPAWFNYHRLLFRPRTRTAELIISDWKSSTEPGAPAGQELVCNFFEIQPYLPK